MEVETVSPEPPRWHVDALARPPVPGSDRDPGRLDLSELPEFGPAPACTNERFLQLDGLLTVVVERDGTREGEDARTRLLADGRCAFPVILNRMRTLDLATASGLEYGDRCEKLLRAMCAGRNFAWRDSVEPKDVLFNEKVVVAWTAQWQKVLDQGIENWISLTKLEESDPAKAARLRQELGSDAGG